MPTTPHLHISGKAGATKLIQYAHWERDRFKASEKPPPTLKLNLSDNCIDRPADLTEELKGKRIRLSVAPVEESDKETTVFLPDFVSIPPDANRVLTA